MEWWDSEDAWNEFFAGPLQAAFQKVGGIPEPKITRFDVHNSFTRA